MSMITGDKVPLTATHYSIEDAIYLRLASGRYAQQFVGNRWVKSNVENSKLLRKYSTSDCFMYMRLFKTGVSRDLCNIRLFFIGSNYRI